MQISKKEVALIELIKTNNTHNIELALQLSAANKIELKWYRYLYEWLRTIGKIGTSFHNNEKMLNRLLSIKELNYTHKKLAVLPSFIAGLHNLEYLRLYSNELEQLPPSIVQLKALKHFILTHNNLQYLPANLGLLDNLSELWLGFNNIKVLPESLTNLIKLQRLYLQHNFICDFDERILQLPNLNSCFVFGNPLIKPINFYQKNYPNCQFTINS